MSHFLKGESPTSTAVADQAVSVLICTYNRGALIAATIESILKNDYPSFEVIVVDQSKDDRTQDVLTTFKDPRIRYIRSETKGLGAARNFGLQIVGTDLVLMTDDDCEVPSDWISQMVQPFLAYPQVGLVFCDVIAPKYDTSVGFIPVNISNKSMLIKKFAQWQTTDGVNIGIGAGMAVRTSNARAIGEFDTALGAGARFLSGEDLDFALRMLLGGFQIYRTIDVHVLHHGFRTHQQARRLIRDGMFSIGIVYAKLVKHGNLRAFFYYLSVIFFLVVVPFFKALWRREVPRVLGRIISLIRGFAIGLFIPIYRQEIRFRIE